jgi:hypothetical protein
MRASRDRFACLRCKAPLLCFFDECAEAGSLGREEEDEAEAECAA